MKSYRKVFYWPGHQGTYRLNHRGPQGKTAKKEWKKAVHIPGYYGKLKRGEMAAHRKVGRQVHPH